MNKTHLLKVFSVRSVLLSDDSGHSERDLAIESIAFKTGSRLPATTLTIKTDNALRTSRADTGMLWRTKMITSRLSTAFPASLETES